MCMACFFFSNARPCTSPHFFSVFFGNNALDTQSEEVESASASFSDDDVATDRPR